MNPTDRQNMIEILAATLPDQIEPHTTRACEYLITLAHVADYRPADVGHAFAEIFARVELVREGRRAHA